MVEILPVDCDCEIENGRLRNIIDQLKEELSTTRVNNAIHVSTMKTIIDAKFGEVAILKQKLKQADRVKSSLEKRCIKLENIISTFGTDEVSYLHDGDSSFCTFFNKEAYFSDLLLY